MVSVTIFCFMLFICLFNFLFFTSLSSPSFTLISSLKSKVSEDEESLEEDEESDSRSITESVLSFRIFLNFEDFKYSTIAKTSRNFGRSLVTSNCYSNFSIDFSKILSLCLKLAFGQMHLMGNNKSLRIGLNIVTKFHRFGCWICYFRSSIFRIIAFLLETLKV
jgi:hypothetical protein